MPFAFERIKSVEFGVCLDGETEETYRLVPSDKGVQTALCEMLEATRAELFRENIKMETFSPAEKYGSTERLVLSLDSDFVTKHKEVFASENLTTDTHGLDDPSKLVSYFAVFRDQAGHKLMAFRRAGQFKGVVQKNLVTFLDDTLKIVEDHLASQWLYLYRWNG
jgi:hypothetical protein